MTALEKQVQDFKNKIDNLDSAKQKTACKILLKELDSKYSLSTVRTKLTSYRKALIPVNEELKDVLRISKKKQGKLQSKHRKTIAKTNRKLKPVRKYRAMIQCAERMLKNDNVADITAGLCLLTGRRMSEVLKTAKFTNRSNNTNKAYFSGQLKSKGTDKQKDKVAIYTLVDRAIIKEATKRLRQLCDTSKLTTEQINRKFESSVNSACWSSFDMYIGKCTSHDLRKVYGAICREWYKPAEQSDNSFLASILGHSSDDLNTVNSYNKYYLKK